MTEAAVAASGDGNDRAQSGNGPAPGAFLIDRFPELGPLSLEDLATVAREAFAPSAAFSTADPVASSPRKDAP